MKNTIGLKEKMNNQSNYERITLQIEDLDGFENVEMICEQIACIRLHRRHFYLLHPTANEKREALVFYFEKNSLKLLKESSLIDEVFKKYYDLLTSINVVKTVSGEFLKSYIPCVPMGEKDEGKLLNINLRLQQKILAVFRKEVSSVVGQAHAIKKLEGYLSSINEIATLPKSIFFLGPPGVGKTMLAEAFAKAAGIPFLLLSMTQYSDKESYNYLFSLPRSYREAHEELLTKFIEDNVRCVVAIDEVELAHPSVLNVFLQILQQGKYHDNYIEKDVNCSEVTFVFTSNLGGSIYNQGGHFILSNVPESTILNAISNEINPITRAPYLNQALIDRLMGNLVLFNKLQPFSLYEIIRNEIQKTKEKYEGIHRIKFKINENDLAQTFLYGQNPNAFSIRGAKKKVEQFFKENLSAVNEALLEKDVNGYFTEITFENGLFGFSSKVDSLLFEGMKKRILFYTNDMYQLPVEKDTEVVYINKFTDLYKLDDDFSTVIINIDNKDDIREAKKAFNVLISRENAPIYVTAQSCNMEKGCLDYFMKNGACGFSLISKKTEFLVWYTSIKNALNINFIFAQLQRQNSVIKTDMDFFIEKELHKAVIKVDDVELRKCEVAGSKCITVAEIPQTTFDEDVLGDEEITETMKVCAEYLSNYSFYKHQGVQVPSGILLAGLPGTGKTLRAKAMANYAKLPFIEMNATELLQRYVGEGPEKLRNAFKTLRNVGGGILFIDEIDTILRARGGSSMHYYDELCNTLLSCMDGFKESKTPVLVIGATNETLGNDTRLDKAALRRFDYKFTVSLPKVEDREKFLAKELSKKCSSTVSKEMIHGIAVRSIEWNYSDLNKVVQNAHRESVKLNCSISDELFNEAFESYSYGKAMVWTEDVIRKTAIHEAGHAVISCLNGDVPSYTTVISRGNFGGYTLHEEDKRFDYSKQMLLDRIRVCMGGRAAEVVFCGEEEGITTGASADMKQATQIAKAMVCDYGMYEDFFFYTENKDTQAVNDKVVSIIKDQYKKAICLLESHKKIVETVADELVANGSVTQEKMKAIVFGG